MAVKSTIWSGGRTGRGVRTIIADAVTDVAATSAQIGDPLAILLDSVAAHVNVGWLLDLLITCRSIGAGAACLLVGQGTWTSEDILGTPAAAPKGSLSAVLPWNTAPTAGNGFDSTIANTLDLFFTQTVATGSMTVFQY